MSVSLSERPAAYSFFQAVRMLEELGRVQGRAPVGFDADPKDEAVRLAGVASLAFPVGDVRDVSALPADRTAPPPLLRTTFLGFVGTAGILPQHVTELITKRLQQKDSALQDWLDLLLHRTLSLLQRAWRKQRPLLTFEQAHHHPDLPDPTTRVLQALVGMATGALADRDAIADRTRLHFAGQLAPLRRSAAGLASVVNGWLGKPVRVQEWVGRWLPIEAADASRLPSRAVPDGSFARLGSDFVIGTRSWDVTSRVRLEVGPITYPDYLAILPGGRSHAALAALVRAYVGPGIDFDLELRVELDSAPCARLAARAPAGRQNLEGSVLGRDAWLGNVDQLGTIGRERFTLTAPAERPSLPQEQ